MDSAIVVYGVDTCEDTTRTRDHLDELGIGYTYVNLDVDAEAERRVREWNNGKRITPTVVLSSASGSKRMAEPENSELDAELQRLHLLPPQQRQPRRTA